jgi:hypothetical protein
MLSSKEKPDVDSFDRNVICQTMQDSYYLNQKIVPSVVLLSVIKEKIDFPWQKDVLRNTLQDMCSIWKHSLSKILVERLKVYLIKMQAVRAKGMTLSDLMKHELTVNEHFGSAGKVLGYKG